MSARVVKPIAVTKLAWVSEELYRSYGTHVMIRIKKSLNSVYAPVTRQITLPTSSATSSEPSAASVTPTGRP